MGAGKNHAVLRSAEPTSDNEKRDAARPPTKNPGYTRSGHVLHSNSSTNA